MLMGGQRVSLQLDLCQTELVKVFVFYFLDSELSNPRLSMWTHILNVT